MLQKTTISFLKDLKKNNNREWFETNRGRYEAAKLDFENFAGTVLEKMRLADPTIADLKPKDCTFRINRDVRFSKNKAPYKSNMAMYISQGGKKTNNAGYYLHCEPGAAFIAGGMWMPMAPELKLVRQEIDYNWDEFKAIITAKKFKATFSDLQKTPETSLTRPPKGYEEQNAAIDYLKLKSFIASSPIEDSAFTTNDLVKKVVANFETMKPLIQFLNRALEV
jgi:uncharacterized protein (TIGR02453 family)